VYSTLAVLRDIGRTHPDVNRIRNRKTKAKIALLTDPMTIEASNVVSMEQSVGRMGLKNFGLCLTLNQLYARGVISKRTTRFSDGNSGDRAETTVREKSRDVRRKRIFTRSVCSRWPVLDCIERSDNDSAAYDR